MASSTKHKTTMAKLNRERALRERREIKAAKKEARRAAAAAPPPEPESEAEVDGEPEAEEA
jgi:hypothetical protein